jgi:CRP/FNR family transcriptional regulator, anaerobic regulatory protein
MPHRNKKEPTMITLQHGNTGISSIGSSAQPILRRLLAPLPVSQLDASETERLEGVQWLVRRVGKGCAVVDQGDERRTIFVLLSGWAFRYQTLPDGKRQILDFILDGALVGFGAGDTNWYGVETVTDCVVASVPHAQFRRLLGSCPSLAVRVAERVSESERRAHEHMTSLGRRSARGRIAAFIVELASRTGGGPATCRSVLDLPLTQIMIGDALGLSNEHVCRTLGKLADDGVIELGRLSLRVLNPRALAREAALDGGDVPGDVRLLPAAA